IVSVGICAILMVGEDSSNPVGNIFDLVVSRKAIYYEPIKSTPYEPDWRPRLYESGLADETIESLKATFNSLKKDHKWERFQLIEGSVLSGEKVLADRDRADSLRGAAYRKLGEMPVALEMEFSGIAAVCDHERRPFLLIKAASDFADSSKDWSSQPRAAHISIKTCLSWLESLNEHTIQEIAFQVIHPSKLAQQNLFHAIQACLGSCSSGLPPRGYPGDEIEATEKEVGDFVTTWDYAVQRNLFLNLARKVDWVYAEEKWAKAFEAAQKDIPLELKDKHKPTPLSIGLGLIIDPIDGSANFVDGRPEVAISIAVVRNGQVESAHVCMPYRDTFVMASHGTLSVNGQKVGFVSPLFDDLEKVRVSLPGDVKKLEGKAELKRATDSGVTPLDLFDLFERIVPEVGTIRISGALGYDLCALALGELDARISTNAKIEDIAPGIALLKCRGGVVTTLAGKEIDLVSHDPKEGILAATSMQLHRRLLELIHKPSPGSTS
ncbi:MAG: inositol monophosphatase family protein, partial [bacterium]